jgi:hypothetical protein
MPKFSVTYSVNSLFEIFVEATDKEDAISKVNGSHGGEALLLAEEYLGINVVKDVTHEHPQNAVSKTENPLKSDRAI